MSAKGMVVCQGWLLKLVTLLVELESAVAMLYVNIRPLPGLHPTGRGDDGVAGGLLVSSGCPAAGPARSAGES